LLIARNSLAVSSADISYALSTIGDDMPKLNWEKLEETPFTPRQSQAIHEAIEYIDDIGPFYSKTKGKLRELLIELVEAFWDDIEIADMDAQLDSAILSELQSFRAEFRESCARLSGTLSPSEVKEVLKEEIVDGAVK
jgi:hypothetical protein